MASQPADRPGARLTAGPRSLVRSLSGQLALIAAVSVAPVLAGLVVLSTLMVVSDHAVVLVSAIAVGACLLALAGARLFSRAIAADLEAVRTGLEAIGEGRPEAPIVTSASDELAALADAANAMMARLADERDARDASESARRHLIAAVSHDLRTPLTSVRLLADAVGDEIVDGAGRRSYLERMRTHIDALGGLVDDLFELSRIEAGDISWSLEQVGLRELLGETVEAMRVHADAKGVRVSADVGDVDTARANPEQLQRVLFNLIQNAIRHTPPDGTIVVRAEPTAEAVAVEVLDSGSGIAAAEREAVFEPFRRGGTLDDVAPNGSAGLGLAVSRAIVEAHGGRIWVADSGVGARIRFTLPRAFPET